MAKFNAITYNCNGIGNKIKRQRVFTYLKEKLKCGFVFLQETHSTENLEKEWRSQWGGEMFFRTVQVTPRGVLLPFLKNFL